MFAWQNNCCQIDRMPGILDSDTYLSDLEECEVVCIFDQYSNKPMMLKQTYPSIAITALLIIFTVQVVSAQQKSVSAVEKAVNQLIQAMLKPDAATLNNLVTNELTYGHSSGKIEDKAAFVSTLVSGASVFEKIDISAQTVQVVDRTAIVRHTLTAKTNDPGKGPATIKLGIMLTWVQTHGSWKLLARQAFKLP